jgi:hypothetical protein
VSLVFVQSLEPLCIRKCTKSVAQSYCELHHACFVIGPRPSGSLQLNTDIESRLIKAVGTLLLQSARLTLDSQSKDSLVPKVKAFRPN